MSATKSLATLVLALFSALAWGAGASKIPPQIEMAIQSGAKLVRTFSAASQLKGWVLSRGGHYTIVYTTPDNRTLLAGELIDAAGKNLSQQYANKYLPKPDTAALFAELARSPYIAEGRRKQPSSIIYALFDPNCPYCHLAWEAFQPYEKAGLEVRWIPVAYLRPSSPGKAAAIMEAKNRLAAFRKNEEGYDMRSHEGGIAPLAKPSAQTLHELRADNALMQKLGADGTPALIWKDRAGKPHMKVGLPLMRELPAITGLPAQTENNPDLASFR